MNGCSFNAWGWETGGRALRVAAMLALLVAAGGPDAAGATGEAAQAPGAREEDRRIAELVRQLEAGDFARRERAMRGLVEAGPAAIGPLEEAFAQQGLETTSRGVYVLEQLARLDDAQVQQRAVAVLEKLAARKQSAGHAFATGALAEIAEFRRERAVDLLRRRGAQFTHLTSIGPEPVPFGKAAVELGESWRGTDEDLQQLAWLTDITVVCLTGPQFSDSSLKALQGLKHLEWLKLKRCSISTQGLAQLSALPNLHQIALNYMPLDDQVVEVLQAFPALDTAILFGTRVSDQGAAALVESNLKVHHRKGAFLGISFQDQCLVAMVSDGSAADRAGIQPGDQILALGDKRVESNDELVEAIGMFEPGDSTELQLARPVTGGRESVVRVKVTFDEWP